MTATKQIVIYDDETMEPISVVNIPSRLLKDISSRLRPAELRLLVPHPASDLPSTGDRILHKPHPVVIVRLYEIIRDANRTLWFATAVDFENALKLYPELLPGQVGHVQERERVAALAGFLEALLYNASQT